MFKIETILITFGILLLWSCANPAKEKQKNENTEPQKSEIFTKTYSVKFEDGKARKDTVNMIQSIIVNKAGKEIANKFYNLDGSVSWTDAYVYDKVGNKIGSKFFENGKQTIYYEYDIDDLGRKIAFRAKSINTDTLLYDGATRFLENGKIKRDGYVNKKGEFIYNFEYQYDEQGHELGYVYFDLRSKDEYPSTYNYIKFNDEGEWIEREIIENNKVVSFEVRETQPIN